MDTQAVLTASVALTPDCIEAKIRDRRPDALSVFGPLTDGQRSSLVTDAWSIGLRALANAHRYAEESRLEDIGKTLVSDVDTQLKTFIERQQATFVQVMARYFDPRDGQVTARLQEFLQDGGELAKTMERFLAPEHGALAQTLARELGENSPLLRRLSPTDSEGVVSLLEAKLRLVFEANNAEIARALDPMAENGAIARFLRTLRHDLEKADNDRSKQLTLATKALDANDENSLLSRLVRETGQARTAFVSAMNPDVPNSPMAVLKGALAGLLQQHMKSQQDAMAAFQQRQVKLEQDIRESLTRLEERRRGDSKSIRGGFAFEEAVLRFVQRAVQGAPVVVDVTANSVGARPGCKVGDQVIRFTSESIYAGAAIVVEAKHDGTYTATRALQELEVARGNRCAGTGLFVMARSHAPAGFPPFARFGSDVLVVWDEGDDATDPYLLAALLLTVGLTTRRKRPEDSGDIRALADIESRIQAELGRHEKMRRLSESIRKNAEEIGEELRKGSDKLDLLLRNAKGTLKALNVELLDAEEERAVPLQLPSGALTGARAALYRNDRADIPALTEDSTNGEPRKA